MGETAIVALMVATLWCLESQNPYVYAGGFGVVVTVVLWGDK
jgi:hypothetical protein